MVELKISSGLHFAVLPHAAFAQGLPILIDELEALCGVGALLPFRVHLLP
jgi:hypothetical protein